MLSVTLLAACSTLPEQDYSAYRMRMPYSILVLPPLNDSIDVNAPYAYLPSVIQPLAEAGYYVFPVAVVDAFMKENGMIGAAEMHQVSLKKFKEIIGADAVLYINIEEWGQQYLILNSVTVVKFQARLVDTQTGAMLWKGEQDVQLSSNQGQSGILTMALSALVSQISNDSGEQAYRLSKQANHRMVNSKQGLLLGPYHPNYEKDQRGR